MQKIFRIEFVLASLFFMHTTAWSCEGTNNPIELKVFDIISGTVQADLVRHLEIFNDRISKNSLNDKCETFIFSAVRHRNVNALKVLEKFGYSLPPVNDRDIHNQKTLYEYALLFGSVELIRDFKVLGGGLVGKPCIAELEYAIQKNSSEVVEYLIDRDFDGSMKPQYEGVCDGNVLSPRTRVMVTAIKANRDLNIFSVLLNKGADPNAVVFHDPSEEHGFPLVTIAAKYNATNAIISLVRYGADLENKAHIQKTPLQIARERGFQNLVKLLVEFGAIESVSNGKCINSSKRVKTAFSLIESDSDRMLVDYLYNNPIARSARNSECEPLYVYAIKKRRTSAVHVLETFRLSYETNESIVHLSGFGKYVGGEVPTLTPYDVVIMYGHPQQIKEFKNRGGEISRAANYIWMSNDVNSEYLAASRFNQADAIEYLVSLGANPRITTDGKELDLSQISYWSPSALMIAAQYNSIESIRYLVKIGVPKEYRDSGKTAYDYAVQANRSAEILKLLKL